MTREEAIEVIEQDIPCERDTDLIEAFEMAIKALKQEPCEDAISKKEVLNQIFYSTDNSGDVVLGSVLRHRIENLPPVNPQKPKTGHWEWVQYDYNPKLGNWHCSECRCIVLECVDKEEKGGIPLYKYCPQCGAKMQEAEIEG